MEIEKRPIEAVIPYASNPRRNQAAVSKVAASIKEFGFRQPIVVDSGGVIIAGHTRLQAAQTLGLSEVPVHVADNLNPQQVKAYRIADNRAGEESEWDMELLALELEALKAEGCALEPLGFEDSELDSMRGLSVEGEGLTDPDEVPEGEEPFLRSGDLLELGGHRLLCGDSTKVEDVERLMDGKKADMVLTDPPYGVGYTVSFSKAAGGKDLGKQAAYHESNGGEVLKFLGVASSPVVLMTYPIDSHLLDLSRELCDAGFVAFRELVWVKNKASFHPGSTFQQGHEPILLCRRAGAKMPDIETISTVIEWESPSHHEHHPTQKPIGLWVKLLAWYSGRVFDPFLGSGSTLIACEKTGRKCYGMEIAPHYCDVIVERWAKFTGKDELILNGNPLVWSQRGPRGSNV